MKRIKLPRSVDFYKAVAVVVLLMLSVVNAFVALWYLVTWSPSHLLFALGAFAGMFSLLRLYWIEIKNEDNE